MRRIALICGPICALCVPGMAAADWVALGGVGVGVAAALTGRTLEYEHARQDFRASGKTLYVTNGQDSWGNWEVRGDMYCSQWPPSDLWACYRLEVDGERVRFVGDAGDVTEGAYAD